VCDGFLRKHSALRAVARVGGRLLGKHLPRLRRAGSAAFDLACVKTQPYNSVLFGVDINVELGH
jgi:hypothetical protein